MVPDLESLCKCLFICDIGHKFYLKPMATLNNWYIQVITHLISLANVLFVELIVQAYHKA